ncbi:hypothetical protein DNHGIG_21910 [Collibacillus ludicampi]|uniref:Uncharacterized protein n=1 Tax=Collibacillus ludicampi TaxID=2771369 RepID=A0AAV4LFR2_9BACL|nr:hypothetical protein DNHGIG_21910 [Collibacillus ludicampi]
MCYEGEFFGIQVTGTNNHNILEPRCTHCTQVAVHLDYPSQLPHTRVTQPSSEDGQNALHPIISRISVFP